MCPAKSLQFFTIDQTMIIILSWKNYQTSSKANLNVLEKNKEKCKTFSVPIEK